MRAFVLMFLVSLAGGLCSHAQTLLTLPFSHAKGLDTLVVVKKPQSLQYNAPEPIQDTLQFYWALQSQKQPVLQETAFSIGPAYACTTESGQSMVLVKQKQDGMGNPEYINAYSLDSLHPLSFTPFPIINPFVNGPTQLHLLLRCSSQNHKRPCLCRVDHFKRFEKLYQTGVGLLGSRNIPYASGLSQDTLPLQTIPLFPPHVWAFLNLADSLATPDTSVTNTPAPYVHSSRWQNSSSIIRQVTVQTGHHQGLSVLLRHNHATHQWSLLDASILNAGSFYSASQVRLTPSDQLHAILCKSCHLSIYQPDTVTFDFLKNKLYNLTHFNDDLW